MESLLVTVAPYSLVAAAVFALLFVADFVAIALYVARSGKIDPEEGHVVTENRALKSGDVAMGGTSAPGGCVFRRWRSAVPAEAGPVFRMMPGWA